MLKAVFRPNELITLKDKVVIDSPTSYPEIAHLSPEEDLVEEIDDVDEYKGPTADDLRREAEMFKAHWEEEKERMISSARSEADRIVSEAQNAANAQLQRQMDEGQVLKQQAVDEADKIVADAQIKVSDLEKEIRQTLEAERREAREQGETEGKTSGYAEGKAEVDRLIERTQTVLERAQDKRGDILKETEKEIVDLVLLISRKIIKVISENQRNVIISNVIEALRKVRAKGNVLIRVNLSDLALATEHKQEFINMMENVKSINIVEDSSVDSGGCIIETDFGEIDARIASQLAELENKILEISPIQSRIKENTPPPIINTVSLNSELAAASSLLGVSRDQTEPSSLSNPYTSLQQNSASEPKAQEEENEMSHGAEAALTASAALAALATMATKGKRESDKKIAEKLESIGKRKTDGQ